MQLDRPVRVQKAIADRGLASRRQAEEWIQEGRVTVNGRMVTLGEKCLPGRDTIMVDEKALPRREPPRLVLAMHKPRGYICTNADPHANKTVFDLLPPELRSQRLFCVGRLDKDSEGLLLLTNDGDLRQRLAHPSNHVQRKYHVDLDDALREADVPKLIKGIHWEGERLSIDKVFPRAGRGADGWKSLEVTLHHGRKREIRRLFYAFGYNVKRLKRVQFGQYKLRGIPRGLSRLMGPAEIRLLFAPPPEGKPKAK